MTPIDRLIDASVRCHTCGRAFLGNKCPCWDGPLPVSPEEIQETAEEIAANVLYHIDTMYPAMWLSVPRTARVSVRHTIISLVARALKEHTIVS